MSRKMQHRHTLHLLFVRGLETVTVAGGLGVEVQQNGLVKSRPYFSLKSWAKQEVYSAE